MTNIIKLSIYGVVAVATLSLMLFVVLPQLPQVNKSFDSFSTSAAIADAWGEWSGSGDYGGGCCDGGNNGGSDYNNNSWGDWSGSGDYGAGCCDSSNGGSDYSNGGSDFNPPPPPPPPPPTYPATCDSFTASRTTVPHNGANVVLTWNTTNATSVSINNGVGNVAADGSQTVFVNSNTTFTLTAVGTGGNASCVVSITKENPPVTHVATCDSFTADRTTVPYNGGNVVLTWNTTNATSVSINNGVGNVTADGSKNVFVNSNTTFTLTAVGTGGNASCVVSITKENPPVTHVATCDSFTADRTTVPYNGGNVVLTWNTTNATSVSINNGVGNVAADGSKNVFVNSNTTFTLTAVGTGGNASCTVTITKETDNNKVARCDYLRVSDDEVEKGDDVTLSWETTNATSVSINQGIGNVSADGSRTVEINNDTTFTLTAQGTNGSDTCTVRVEIEDDKDDRKKTPKCELDISKERVKRGEKVTLSWETTNVDEIVIKDDRGKTIFDTDDYSKSQRKKYFDGEIDVIINQSTEFRMTAEGEDGGRKTCKVDVDVEDIAVYEKRDQALVIALTQVPYTGFEAGAFLTFLFYAVLTLWALFIAYILVIKKGSILGFSFFGQTSGMSEADVENRKKVEALVAKYAGQNWK